MSRTDVNLFWLRPGEHAAYRGQAILIVDAHARVAQGIEGFFLHRTRFLSHYVMKVNGEEPTCASANPVLAHVITSYHLAPSPAGAEAGPEPDDKESSGGEMAKEAIEIQVNRFVGGGLHQDVHVTNHGRAETEIVLSWELAADFADQSEAQQGERQQSAPVLQEWSGADSGGCLEFRYLHPDLPHRTLVRFAGPGAFTEGLGIVSCLLKLPPQQPCRLSVDVCPVFRGETIEPFYGVDGAIAPGADADQVRDEWFAGCARLSASNPVVQTAWDRAASDLGSLQLLEGEGPEKFTPAGGIPNYIALFGRDALMASWQSAMLNPATLRGTLGLISKWTASSYDDKYDAQPGKVLHQRQLSPLAILGKNPFLHYYGDYSAAGLFLLDLAGDFAISGDRDFFLSMQDKALATLEWMDRDGDADGDGFYEYQTQAGEGGTKNQGWKDSNQAILYPDGRLVKDPIAVCEIQGLYFAAKQAMGLAFGAIGEQARGSELLSEAEALKQRFNERFWMEDERFFALALDPDKRPVRSIASNAGACLAYGIIDDDKAGAVVERLMAPDMFSGWGIRTLSSGHPAFNPLSYHLGSVWPFANALTGSGLKRYGAAEALHKLARGLFDASQLFHLNRLPEVFGGHARDVRHPHPGIYPSACAPQAWSSSAVICLVQSMLGLVPLAPAATLIVDPDLPDWLAEVALKDVRIGSATVSLLFRREPGGQTSHEVTRLEGSLRVCRAGGADPGAWQDRLMGAVREVVC